MPAYGQQLIELAKLPVSGSSRAITRNQRTTYVECVAHIADEMNAGNYAVCGYGRKRNQAKDLAKQWVRECRSAAILPLLWWIVKPWIMNLLIELAERWIIHLQTGTSVVITGQAAADDNN